MPLFPHQKKDDNLEVVFSRFLATYSSAILGRISAERQANYSSMLAGSRPPDPAGTLRALPPGPDSKIMAEFGGKFDGISAVKLGKWTNK